MSGPNTPSAPARHLARLAALALVAGAASAVSAAPAAAATLAATVEVNTQQGLGTIPDTAFGLNTAVYDGFMTDAPVADLVRDAGIGMLRYPGGSYGDIYHWQTNTADGGFVAPNTDFDSFMGMVDDAGAQPIIIANYGSGTPAEAADWVRYANVTHDYDARYWEIGNEVYGNGHYGAQWENDTHADKSPTAYATNLLDYISAMKAVDPTIQIGAVLTTPGGFPDGVVAPGDDADWNHTVLSIAGDQIDFAVVHWYPGGSDVADMLTRPRTVPDAVFQLRSLIDELAGANAPNIDLMITETNSTLAKDTQPAALFAADDTMAWLENGAVNLDWWNLHNGASGPVTTVAGRTDFNDEGVLSNGTCIGGVCEPAPETPFASYYGLAMLTHLGGPGDQMVAATANQPLVSAHAVRRADGALDVMLINTDPDDSYDITVDITGFEPVAETPTVFSYGPADDTIVSARRGTATSQTVGPYSITTVVLHPTTGGANGPSAPGRPSVSDLSTDSATLSWSPATPGDAPIGSYEVLRRVGSNSVSLGTTPATSLTVTGLEPGTTYTVNVIATDTAGVASPPSDPVTFTTPTPTDSTCAVAYRVVEDWGSGFGGDIVITNTGADPVSGWTLAFDFPASGQRVTGGWNGTWAQTGAAVTVTDAGWNATIAPGGSTEIGFLADHAGPNPTPTAFALNGTVCATV